MALKDVKIKLADRFRVFTELLDTIKLPGFKKVGLYQVLRFFVNGLTDRRFSLMAMGMAYRFMFALFPALILILTTIPEGLHDEILGFFNDIVPAQAFGVVNDVVDEFFDKPGFGLISFNFLLMLYSSLTGIKAMMYAFSRNDDMFRKRKFLQVNLVALLIFVGLLVLFLFMLAILVFGEYFILTDADDSSIIRTDWVASVFRIGYWLVILGGLQVAVSVLYYLGPETKDRWAFFSPGSLLAGTLCMLAIIAFKSFVGQFADFNKVYGSIGALMLTMFWFYWISVVLLIGFELNRAIDKAKFRAIQKGKEEIELTEEDVSEAGKAIQE